MAHLAVPSKSPSKDLKFRISARSILFKACALSLVFPSGYFQNRTHARYLVDYFVNSLLAWAAGLGAYNPKYPYPNQQNNVHLFLLKCPNIPYALIESITFLRGNLTILLRAQSLARVEGKSSYHYLKYHQKTQQWEGHRPHLSPPSEIPFSITTPRPPGDTTITPIRAEPIPDSAAHIYIPSPHLLPNKSKSGKPMFGPAKSPCPQCSSYCNSRCLTCRFFNCHHPSPLCCWSVARPKRSIINTVSSYNPQPVQFHFCLDDMQKIQDEVPEVTKKFNPEEDSHSSFTQHSTSTTSIDSAFSVVSESGEKNTKNQRTKITSNVLEKNMLIYGRNTQIGKNGNGRRKLGPHGTYTPKKSCTSIL
jgi:hypothetical protein